MGWSGPPPKRSEERIRENVYPDISKAPAGAGTPAPYEPDDRWHPTATAFWRAYEASGQSRFYEPSDWMKIYLMCEAISRELRPQFIGFSETVKDGQIEKKPVQAMLPLKGATLSALNAWMTTLLTTEVDRRRSLIELQKDTSNPTEDRAMAAVASLQEAMEKKAKRAT